MPRRDLIVCCPQQQSLKKKCNLSNKIITCTSTYGEQKYILTDVGICYSSSLFFDRSQYVNSQMRRSINFMSVPEVDSLLTQGNHAAQLWKEVVRMLHGPTEVDCVKTAVGDDLIAMNASAAEELASLLEILSDLRSEGDGPSVTSPLARNGGLALASANKDFLQERLRQLLAQARTADEVFQTPREKLIVEYVAPRPTSSATTRSRSFDSRPTSVGGSSSRSSNYQDPCAGLSSLKGSLRFDLVHNVREQLRDCFRNEYEIILEDVAMVRELIEEQIRANSVQRCEPTAAELRDMTKRLEDAEMARSHRDLIQRLPDTGRRGGSLAALK